MLIVFLGPPGAGKGTQSQRLIDLLDIPCLSTGEMLRAAKESGTALGNSIAEQLDTGQLIEDETVVQLVIDRLNESSCQNGAMLDGFPRTQSQAQSLDRYLDQSGKALDLVIQLVVPESELLQRLCERFLKLDHPRPEDHPDFVATRLEIYEKITKPLSEYYKSRGILAEVDGMGNENEVFDRIQKCLNERVQKS